MDQATGEETTAAASSNVDSASKAEEAVQCCVCDRASFGAVSDWTTNHLSRACLGHDMTASPLKRIAPLTYLDRSRSLVFPQIAKLWGSYFK